MRIRLPELCLGTLITVATAIGTAGAQPALDDDAQPAGAPTTDPTVAATQPTGTPTQYGVTLRLRNVRIPKGLLELFVERSAGGASNFGYGVELSRRRGTVELQLGLEFEHLTVGEGPWINKGENVAAGDEADYILDPEHAPDQEQLGWFTIEFTFLNHAEINKYVSFRYGGGAGLGILTGALWRYDVICVNATNDSPEPGCVPAQRGGTGIGTGPVKYDLPPVFPVINGIIGVQVKPVDKVVINVETGIRTVPFFGMGIGYYF